MPVLLEEADPLETQFILPGGDIQMVSGTRTIRERTSENLKEEFNIKNEQADF